MNPKLKELALRAGFEFDTRDCNFYASSNSAACVTKELFRFADLLVDECCIIASENSQTSSDSLSTRMLSRGKLEAAQQIIDYFHDPFKG